MSRSKISSRDFPDVLILCGGRGTRLQSVVVDRPKPLAEVRGEPFLDILLRKIFSQGFTRAILAVGHGKKQIMEKYSSDPRISFSVEEKPLGTGGAVAHAMKHIHTDHFIAMNGDSHCEIDLAKMYNEHLRRGALASIALVKMPDSKDFGSVEVDAKGRIQRFSEKTDNAKGDLINAGVYAFDKKIKHHMPVGENFSLEYDLFPAITTQVCYGHIVPGNLIDIGTPERYELANRVFFRD